MRGIRCIVLLTFGRSLGSLSTLGRSLSVGLSGLGFLGLLSSLLSRLLGLVVGRLLLRLVLLTKESTEQAGALAGLGAALGSLVLGLLVLLSGSSGGSLFLRLLLLGVVLLSLFLVFSGLLGDLSTSRLVCENIVSNVYKVVYLGQG